VSHTKSVDIPRQQTTTLSCQSRLPHMRIEKAVGCVISHPNQNRSWPSQIRSLGVSVDVQSVRMREIAALDTLAGSRN
jgi:hypothetical protein